jgi:alkylation response protein AidB-like acyl-CoA dehydrogenase
VDFEPTEIEAEIARVARRFAAERVAPAARENDRLGRFPEDLVREAGALGLLAVNAPAEHGGSAAGAVAYALVMMELAAADPAVAVTVGVTNMVAETLARFGSDAQRARLLPRLASGAAVAGAFALSEPQAGSDSAAIATRATRRGDRWVLDGEKQWITSGDRAGVLVVWARTGPGEGNQGLSAFVVEGGTPGLEVGRHEAKMGIRASTTVSLAFDGCELPADAILGQPGDGFRIAMRALDGGRIGIGAQATGTIRAALAASVRYAKERRAFGVPIAEHEAIRFLLADMKVDLEAARLLTLAAAGRKDRGEPFTREASIAKVFSSEAAQRAVTRAVQVHGGYGYTDEFPVEKLFRDARVQTIYEGTSEIQRLVVAREILRRA